MNIQLHFGEHWHYNLFGLTVNMDTVLTTWLAMVIVLGFSAIISLGLKREPGKFQAFAEMVYSALESIPVSQIGKEGKSFTPWQICFDIKANLLPSVETILKLSPFFSKYTPFIK